MKVHAYTKGIDVIFTIEKLATESPIIDGIYKYLGETELEVKLPKKIVTKEIKAEAYGGYRAILESSIPSNAKNIRILFDVEE